MASFLGGAMRALARHPKTAAFFDTHQYASLPKNWADDPEIVKLARDAYAEAGIESPFFKAFYEGSKLVDAQGRPVPFYHGSVERGLESIDPDFSRGASAGRGAAFGAAHPGTGLSYLGRPGEHLVHTDPAYGNFYGALSSALKNGERIAYPDPEIGGLVSVQIPRGEASALAYPPYNLSTTKLDDALYKIKRNLNEIDWQANLAQLSKSYDSSIGGYPVPRGALENAASRHIAYDLFADVNSDVLSRYSASPINKVFSHPEMGEIYPLYINAKNPLVASGRDDARSWIRLADMDLDAASLAEDELQRLAERGPKVGSVFPFVKNSDAPTDHLAGYLRSKTGHDAMLMRGVYDGGGGDVPPTDVVAYFDSRQAKDALRNRGTFNPVDRNMLRAGLPYAAGGGALAAAMQAGDAEARLRERDLPVQEAWNPVESLALAPMGGFWLDAAMGLAPDIPDIPEEYYEAAQ